jgi:hypothetical protein
MKRIVLTVCCLLAFAWLPLHADQVIMKDGTVYKGKIMIDTDKAILIGNPPYDPTSYLLESKDIEKIIYEEYKPAPPAERRRGFVFESRIGGSGFSSSQLSLDPAVSLYAGAGFRVHPAFELEGGLEYVPAISANKGGLLVSDGTTERRYEHFWMYNGVIGGRLYPFFKKNWPIEPYVIAGYTWSRLLPNASGDSLKGSGWRIGFGAIKPLNTHWFLEARFLYESPTFDTIEFLGREGSIQPKVHEHRYGLFTGLSFRL